MKTNTSKISVLFLMLAIVSVVLTSGCTQNTEPPIPPPPTTPVSQGYIQSFDNNLSYGFEYPETWTMHDPKEFSYIGGIKKVDMFTKPNEGTSITIIAKTSAWKSLDEAKGVIGDALKDTIINEANIEVNGIKGFELTRLESGTKSKMAVFFVNDTIYEFDYGFADNETLFNASESVFDHVVNSFNVK